MLDITRVLVSQLLFKWNSLHLIYTNDTLDMTNVKNGPRFTLDIKKQNFNELKNKRKKTYQMHFYWTAHQTSCHIYVFPVIGQKSKKQLSIHATPMT